jgi:hypothetical protein
MTATTVAARRRFMSHSLEFDTQRIKQLRGLFGSVKLMSAAVTEQSPTTAKISLKLSISDLLLAEAFIAKKLD